MVEEIHVVWVERQAVENMIGCEVSFMACPRQLSNNGPPF